MDTGFLVFVGILGGNTAGLLILNMLTSGGGTAMRSGIGVRPTGV